MKVIAKETLIMSGVIVKTGEIVDLDESVVANLQGLVSPVPTPSGKATKTEEVKTPVVTKTEEVKTPVDSTGAEDANPSASNTETKKEGK